MSLREKFQEVTSRLDAYSLWNDPKVIGATFPKQIEGLLKRIETHLEKADTAQRKRNEQAEKKRHAAEKTLKAKQEKEAAERPLQEQFSRLVNAGETIADGMLRALPDKELKALGKFVKATGGKGKTAHETLIRQILQKAAKVRLQTL